VRSLQDLINIAEKIKRYEALNAALDVLFDVAVKRLTSILNDPWSSNGCRTALDLAIEGVEKPCQPSLATRVKIANANPQLLRASIKFLTTKQSPEKHIEMMNHMTRCTCLPCQCRRDIEASLEDKWPSPEASRSNNIAPRLLDRLMDFITTFLIGVLCDLSEHKFRNPKPNKPSKHQPWPLNPSDLLPNGLEDSVEGLTLWVSGSAGYEATVLKFTGRLAVFYRPIIQSILTQPNYALAIKLPMKHLFLSMEPPKRPKHPMYERLEGPGDMIGPSFDYTCKIIFNYLRELQLQHCAEGGFLFTEAYAITCPSSLPILEQLMTHALSLKAKGKQVSEETMQGIDHFLMLAQMERDMRQGKTPNYRAVFEKPVLNNLRESFRTMADVRKGRCWSANCPAEDSGTRTRLCSGCNLVRYCSEKVRMPSCA
jgi:hypothetical protein